MPSRIIKVFTPNLEIQVGYLGRDSSGVSILLEEKNADSVASLDEAENLVADWFDKEQTLIENRRQMELLRGKDGCAGVRRPTYRFIVEIGH